jgi:hypothetical protein
MSDATLRIIRIAVVGAIIAVASYYLDKYFRSNVTKGL